MAGGRRGRKPASVKPFGPPGSKIQLEGSESKSTLSKDEVICPICYSIILDPVTFPCNHSVCRPCFDIHIWETSINCPCCRCRLSIWVRRAAKDNSIVNLKLKEQIEKQFPLEVAAQRRKKENPEGSNDPEGDDLLATFMEDNQGPSVLDGEIAEPGEIAKDFELILAKHHEDVNKEHIEAELASEAFINEIVTEEDKLAMSQLEEDEKLAQILQEEEEKQQQRQGSHPSPSQSLPVPVKTLISPVSRKPSAANKRRKSSLLSQSNQKRNRLSSKKPLSVLTPITQFFVKSPPNTQKSSQSSTSSRAGFFSDDSLHTEKSSPSQKLTPSTDAKIFNCPDEPVKTDMSLTDILSERSGNGLNETGSYSDSDDDLNDFVDAKHKLNTSNSSLELQIKIRKDIFDEEADKENELISGTFEVPSPGVFTQDESTDDKSEPKSDDEFVQSTALANLLDGPHCSKLLLDTDYQKLVEEEAVNLARLEAKRKQEEEDHRMALELQEMFSQGQAPSHRKADSKSPKTNSIMKWVVPCSAMQ